MNRQIELQHSTFLVTGGAGFIGSNITEFLLGQGCFVRVLDNLSTGKRENLELFFENQCFEFMEGDIRDLSTCQSACSGVDYVLHQGALGSVMRSVADPVTTNEVNINGTLNLLTAARDHHVKQFVYASSSSVYGDEKNLPKREDRVGNPLSPYAVTKKANELYAKNFYDLYGLKTVGLRYFNVFGKRQDPNSDYAAVIPAFIRNILAGRPCVIHGDGEQSRDFTYIDNVVQANIKACLAGEKAWGAAVNIACGEQITICRLYSKLCELLGRDTGFAFSPSRSGDVRHSHADISRASELLGYQPEVGFERGLEWTVDWYVSQMKVRIPAANTCVQDAV